MKSLTFGSLFAGIGGFDLGLERAGMVCKWQVEIDPFCQKVLAKHWPDVRRYRDVREVGKHNLEAVDVICGGFPCQPVSRVGKRKGKEDSRWLWPEFSRVISELRPQYIIVENVAGLLRRGMGDVLIDLSESGYNAEWQCLPATLVGAIHLRHRVYIVACNDSKNKGHTSFTNTNSKRPYREASDKARQSSKIQPRNKQGGVFGPMGTNVAYTTDKRAACFEQSNWWRTEPAVGRVANGIPRRVDRLRALGNAVVPQVAEWIGRRIIEYENR